MINLGFVLSIFNFPLIEIGNNAIGIFDGWLVIFILISLVKKNITLNFYDPIFRTFLILFFLSFFSLFVNLEKLEINLLPTILYSFKFLSFAFLTRMIYGTISKEISPNFFNISLLLFISLLIYNFFIIFEGSFRGQMPFLYNSSGPLGLVILSFALYFSNKYISVLRATLIRSSIIFLWLISFSKTFLPGIFLMISYKLKTWQFLFLLSVTSVLFFLNLSFLATEIFPRLELIFSILSFDLASEALSSFYARINNHWFIYWDDLSLKTSLLGMGLWVTEISFDSGYWFLFYSFGFIGFTIITTSLLIEVFKKQPTEIVIFWISIVVSLLLLETFFVSYRGIEPMIFLYNFILLEKFNDRVPQTQNSKSN